MTRTATHTPINGVAAGWALSAALVILFLICAAIALTWPTSAFGHGWMRVFVEPAGGSIAAFIEGIVGAVAVAWLIAIVFAGVYNQLLSRRQRRGSRRMQGHVKTHQQRPVGTQTP